MRSSFAGLEMSKRTIQIAQKSLDITGGNMGNIGNTGYTRQRVDVYSMHLRSYKNWQTKTSRLALAGQGVFAHGVSQTRDPYLDKRYREMNSYLAETVVKQPVLEELQTTIDLYENVGMDAVLARFKDAVSKYATNSAHLPDLAGNVRESAENIAKMLNSYARDFDRLLEDNVWELDQKLDYVNSLIERVVDYNDAIVKDYKAAGGGVTPYGPLELIDERNMVLDELSSYINIRVYDNPDGSVKVHLGDVLMVDGTDYEQFVLQDFKAFNAAVITASNGQNINFKSGELKGFLDLVNGHGPYANSFQDSGYGIPYYKTAMDVFAETFANLMNETNGVTDNDSSRAMFGSTLDVYDDAGNLVERGPITAETIRISEEWWKDATLIGRNHTFIEGHTVINFDQLDAGSTYQLYVRIGADGADGDYFVEFEAIPDANNPSQEFRDEFGLDDNTVVVATGGLIGKFVEDKLVTVGTLNIAGGADVTDTGLTTSEEVVRQAATANLDGTNPNSLLLALDETVRFGRALDFQGTVFDYVSFISNRLGQGLKFIDDQRENLIVTTNNLLDSRDAVSGVSETEEGINMLIYQKWFNAASRMMTALDECLDRVINGMGRVGL